MTMKRIGVAVALLWLVLSGLASAATTLNSTTLAGAIDNNQQTIPLTAVTNVAVGDWLVAGREIDLVVSVDTNAKYIGVRRAVRGVAIAHVSGEFVWTGPQRRFYQTAVSGTCDATKEAYLPHIVTTPDSMSRVGDTWDCLNSEWVKLKDTGERIFNSARADGGTVYTSAGAITIQPGIQFINGSALAMTLASPTNDQNGMVMYLVAQNASAHTVTYTAGFGGGTTARDVATFGGAVNDTLAVIAVNGTWWVLYTRNVTLG